MQSIKSIEPQPVVYIIYDRAGSTWHYKTIDALLNELERAFTRWSCQWSTHVVDTYGTSYWFDADRRHCQVAGPWPERSGWAKLAG